MDNIVIKEIKINSIFRYFWLKNITDINLNEHCAKCLIGEYDNRILKKPGEMFNLELNQGIYYLCGVAYPFCYDNNFHLAFEYEEGSSLQYTSNGVSILINNAKQLPISSDFIDWSHPKAKFKTYNTCRNWWFANYLNKYSHKS